MRLYAGSSSEFVKDCVHNRIVDRLTTAYRAQFLKAPQQPEVRSWRESLRVLSQVFTEAGLNDHGVLLELEVPVVSLRVDCMITGRDAHRRPSAVIIELKQWQQTELTQGVGLVRTYLAGGLKDVLHPCEQANRYRRYFVDGHGAFHGDDAIALTACAYLHNYHADSTDALLHSSFDAIRNLCPLFTADDVPTFINYLQARLGGGDGLSVMEKIEDNSYRASKRLLDHVADVIKNEPCFILLDEQQVVFSRVMAAVEQGLDHRHKHIFLIRGGPGTGKSVVAINLLSELSAKHLNAQYVTGSKAFTRTLRKIVGKRASKQFMYTSSYQNASPNAVDVLICDEAHRIREFTALPHRARSKKPQIRELMDAARVSIFFIDDRQIVRPGEVGSSQLVRDTAQALGFALEEHKLNAQFRCQGSDAFVNWVDDTLEIEDTATPVWDQTNESFELRIVESPSALESLIQDRVRQGSTARMVAGFCWPWARQPQADGSLAENVIIGEFKHPWNARDDMKGLNGGIPPSSLWAYDSRGIDQVGCIYTAQGFEFDYVGLIWGKDLRYDADQNVWIGDPSQSHDTAVKPARERFLELTKNTYRTLLTRALKGCYIYFMDESTEQFFRSRTRALGSPPLPMPEPPETTSETPIEETPSFPFRPLRPSEVEPYVNCVPLVDLKFAASVFTPTQVIDMDEVSWVELPESFRHHVGLFVAQVIGESMNRRISNGSWCLFRQNPTGDRSGKLVVAQHRSIVDPDLGGTYTIKLYKSEQIKTADGDWQKRVTLHPMSYDSSYSVLELDEKNSSELSVVAELVAVLESGL